MTSVTSRNRTLRALLVALIGFSVSGAGQSIAQPAATSAPSDPGAAREALVRAFAELDDAASEVPTGSFDPQSLTEQVGRDPAKLLEWVRDQTWYAPYRGSLRGASGVLQDRIGSSLDRSLLLAELLRTAGYEVRLAHGSATDGSKTAAAIRPIAADRTPNRKPPEQDQDQQTAAISAQVQLQSNQLLESLKAAGIASERNTQEHLDRWKEALADHWWVQLKQGETWIDADPTLPSARLGDRIAEVKQTVAAPGDDGKLASLPPELLHAVDVKVVIERLESGKLQEASPLTVTFRPADLQGKRIVYTHLPVAYKQTSAAPIAEQAKAIAAVTEFIPAFIVAGASTVNDAVTDAGQINRSPSLDRTAGMGKAVGSTLGGLGGLAGGDTGNASSGIWTAEWLELTVRTPGKPVRTIRREVFDLVGPAARAKGVTAPPAINESVRLNRALALMGETDLLVFGAQPTPEFLTHQYMQSLQKVKRRVLATLDERTAATPANDKAAKPLDFDPRVLGLSPGWGVVTGRLAVSPVAREVYLESPNVFCFSRRPRVLDGKLIHLTRTDLAVNDVAVRFEPGVDPFMTRVVQGVADTAMEAAVVETLGSLTGATVRALNTVNLFMLPDANPVALPSRAADLSAWPADARARAERSVADGAMLIATASPAQLQSSSLGGQVGWWKVDPATGSTIGVTGDGFHAATTERQQIENRVNGLLDIPFKITIEEMKSYTQAEFIQMVVGGKGLSGLQLLRAFQSAVRLHELILLL